MASYKRLLKVKQRAEKWKQRARAAEERVDEYRLYVEKSLVQAKAQGAEIKRLKQLGVTNEYLEGKTKYQEQLIEELEKQIADWKRVSDQQDNELQYRQNLINARDTDLDRYEKRIEELEELLNMAGRPIQQ